MPSHRPFRAPSRSSAGRVALACLGTLLIAMGSQSAARADNVEERVRVDTNLGSFVIRLEPVRAPLTTRNFLTYVKSGYYDGTIFHRVINNFVAQAGGYDQKYEAKKTNAPVPNESGNGLSNKRGTVGLARGDSPHSGNSQFYVNLTDNDELDPTPLRWGYAVFGRVVEGMDVIEKIGRVPTGKTGPWDRDAPLDNVVITHVAVVADGSTAATATTAPGAPSESPETAK